MRLLRALVSLTLLVAASASLGCAGQPRQRPIKTSPVESGAGTTEQARKFLQGRWSLMSFEVYPPGAERIAVKGAGTLTYDDFGNLAMEIRVDEAAAQMLNKAGIVTRQGAISTTGRAVIDMQGKKLTYVLEGQPPAGAAAGPLAASRPRYWQVEGDVLTLTTRDDAGSPLSVGTWKREP